MLIERERDVITTYSASLDTGNITDSIKDYLLANYSDFLDQIDMTDKIDVDLINEAVKNRSEYVEQPIAELYEIINDLIDDWLWEAECPDWDEEERRQYWVDGRSID